MRRVRDYFRPGEDGEVSWRGLIGLMLLTLIPRLTLALKSLPPCNDAFYYFETAAHLDQNHFETALLVFSFNIYPWLLLGIHRLGFGWIHAGLIVSLASSCLTILPLHGWIRRMFDPTTALVSCLLFAMHPLAALSGFEATREAFFWLCYSTALYFLRSGLDQFRLRDLFGGGLAFALAVTTRAEGWSLLIPCLGWPLIATVRNRALWRRLVLIPLSFVLAFPTFMIVANVTLLRNHDRWELGRLEMLGQFFGWTVRQLDGESAAPSQIEAKPAVAVARSPLPAKPPSTRTESQVPADEIPRYGYVVPQKRVQAFAIEFRRAIGLPFLLLLGGGIFAERKRLWRAEYLLLFGLAAAQTLAVWIRLQAKGDINGRYFVMSLLTLLPWFALGAQFYCQLLARLWSRLWPSLSRWSVAVVGLGVVMFAGYHVALAVLPSYSPRYDHRELGRWLMREYGPFETLCAESFAGRCRRIAFYAADETPSTTPIPSGDAPLPEIVIVDVPEAPLTPGAMALTNLPEHLRRRGMVVIEIDGLPALKGVPGFLFLFRPDVLARGNPAHLVSDGPTADAPPARKGPLQFTVRPVRSPPSL